MFKRIFIVLLAVLMVISCIACDPSAGQPDGTEPSETTTSPTDNETTPSGDETTAGGADNQPATGPIVLRSDDVKYTIITAEKAVAGAKDCSSKIFKYLFEKGQTLTPSDDYVQKPEQADNDDCEILIGVTNRPESAEGMSALKTYLDYSVRVVGNKIVISANTDERLAAATDYFIANLKITEDGKLTYIGEHNYVNGYDAYKYKNLTFCGTAISDYSIVVSASATASETDFAEQLKTKIAEETGILLAVKTDAEAKSANEIVIGKTNRPASEKFTSGTVDLKGSSYAFETVAGAVVFAAKTSAGYAAMMEKLDGLIVGEALSVGINESFISTAAGLEDGTNIMVIGNSFLYYGECVQQTLARQIQSNSSKIGLVDNGYLSKLCNSVANNVTVRNCTIGGAGLKSLYSKMTQHHPNYYGVGSKMDSFYDQDFVILQQEGSNASSTWEYAEKLIKLFPPETKFFFFVHDHNVRQGHTNVLNAAKKLRDEYGVTYIPTGHMTYDIWRGATKVPGSSIKYSKNTFVVNWNDSHHPNYLTGYFSTIMIYSAITGESCVGLDWSYVSRDDKKYYTKATSNFVSVLDSEKDMLALQQIADEYLAKYNP